MLLGSTLEGSSLSETYTNEVILELCSCNVDRSHSECSWVRLLRAVA